MVGKRVSAPAVRSKRRRLGPEAAKRISYPYFPLFPHLSTGRWHKVIGGTRHYFGPLYDPDAALAKCQAQHEGLYDGRKPRDIADGHTVRHLFNEYRTAQKRRLEAGDIKLRTLNEYHRTRGPIVGPRGRCCTNCGGRALVLDPALT